MIIAYVLMSKRTAELFVGWRIMFIDRPHHEFGVVGIDVIRCDGLILERPALSPWKWFLNTEWVKKEFEVLGEL